MWKLVPVTAMSRMRRLARHDDGQDLLEYGLLASLIALFVASALTLVGDQISGVLWEAIAAIRF